MSRKNDSDAGIYAECTGKHGYKTFVDANKIVKRMLRSRGHVASKRGWRLSVYRCRYCDLWHMGGDIKR